MKEIAFVWLAGRHKRELRFRAPALQQAAPGFAVLQYETLGRAARLMASDAVFVEDRLNVRLEANRLRIAPATASDSASGGDSDRCNK
jgi:hypothetical protein